MENLRTPTAPPRDWTFVLDRPCPECGFAAQALDPADLPHLVLAATAAWPEVLADAAATSRPARQVWSPLEYGCHVRDLLGVFTERVELIRTRQRPVFPDWDADQAAAAGAYADQDPATVAADIATAAADNAAAWAGVGEAEWIRTGVRSDGFEFSLAALGRYLLHDLRHHLVDVGVR